MKDVSILLRIKPNAISVFFIFFNNIDLNVPIDNAERKQFT